jgi:hypothetical protein
MKTSRRKQWSSRPIAIAVAVAITGVLILLIANHGPWNKPRVEIGGSSTTAEAAQSAGATVRPTEPKPALEPDAPGPKPAQPANPSIERR